MNRIEGMGEDFKNARVVYVTTVGERGKLSHRPMTNYNEDPYGNMWFATFRQTNKVEQIAKNPRVKITFPSSREGEMYEITGSASIGTDEEVREKWRWWMFFWHPEYRKYTWFTEGSHLHERVIINACPAEASVVKGKKFDFMITP